MDKIKILQVNLDGTGGAFSLMLQIQERLQAEYIFDYYWMGTFDRNSNYEKIKKMESAVYEGKLRDNRFIGHILLPIFFYKFLKKHNYGIVHIHGDTALKILMYAWPAKFAKCSRIIIHSHSSGINGDYQKLKLLAHIFCKPLLKQSADVFLACSKEASEWMFSKKNNDIIMIKNGVDLDKFGFNSNFRIKYGRELDTKSVILIGMVGNLSYQKYPEYMVNVLNELPTNYKLIFIGDGPNRPNIESYVKHVGCEERVIFWGNTDKVCEILNVLDIFVMTSRFEGLPVSAIEAQTNGLPCVFSDKITKATKILSNCYFLSINDTPAVWADLIKSIDIKANRESAVQIVKRSGFDIKVSAQSIKEVYELHNSK